jgi:hypothetical protein
MALIITSEEELNQLAPPALPLATDQYSRQYQDQLNNVLRLYFNRITALQQQLSWAQSVDYIDFSLTGTAPHTPGRLDWDPVDATLELDMEYGVVQQIGQETFVRVQNETGVTIPNGTVVGSVDASDDALIVTPYIADGSRATLSVLGVVTHDLPDAGTKGYCTTLGFVREVDTSAFSLGDVIYASPITAGAFTIVKPTAPENVIPIAQVVKVGSTDGIIFVRPVIEQEEYYGTFNQTISYTPAVINTAYAVPFDVTSIATGFSIGTPTSRIVSANSGLYSVAATLQYISSNAANKTVYSWIRKNGTDIADSCRIIGITGNGSYRSVVVHESVSLDPGEYVEIMLAVTDTSVTLVAVAPTAFAPGAPGTNLVIEQVQQ